MSSLYRFITILYWFEASFGMKQGRTVLMTTESINFQGGKSGSQNNLIPNPRMASLEMYQSPRISLDRSLAHPQIENGDLQFLRGDEQVSHSFQFKVR